jgi:putative transposase
MPRQPRFVIPDQPQHVIQRGNNRTRTFLDPSDYRDYLDWMQDACVRHGTLVHAYVLMTNHVHLLMTPREDDGISAVMQSVGRHYVAYFNRKYRRTGTLWEGRYRATLIDTERYLLSCYRYVELNPVRAKLVADPGRYIWSSHRANALGMDDPLVTAHPRYEALGREPGARAEAYRSLFRSDLDPATIGVIRDSTNHGWLLGDLPPSTARRLNRRAHRLVRRGRPLEKVSDPFSPEKGV